MNCRRFAEGVADEGGRRIFFGASRVATESNFLIEAARQSDRRCDKMRIYAVRLPIVL